MRRVREARRRRRRGRAETRDQRAKRPRPDAVRPRQTQGGKQRRVRRRRRHQPDCPILPSRAAARRRMLARCLIQRRMASPPMTTASSGWPMRARNQGVAALARSAASDEKRDSAATASQTAAKTRAAQGDSARRQPRKVATPLAAVKTQPDGKEMAEKGADGCRRHRRLARGRRHEIGDDEDRDGRLQGIGDEGRGGQILAPRAQHVRRADVAGADRAQVRRTGRARQQQPERNRAAEIAERQGQNDDQIQRSPLHEPDPSHDSTAPARISVPGRHTRMYRTATSASRRAGDRRSHLRSDAVRP